VSSIFQLIYHKSALKFLDKQDRKTRIRIITALQGLTQVPFVGDIKQLEGEGELLRLRVGSYRILFSVDYAEEIIFIEAIGNRGDIYKQL
jgi:mRNA interferase RelE/StbE